MSMLEKDLQEVDLDAVEEALDSVDDVSEEEDAFEKALGRDERQSTQSLDATQIYLNEIGFSPLLTPEEEVYYGRLARKGDPLGRSR